MRSPVGVVPGMEGGGLAVGATFGSEVVVVEGALGATAFVTGVGSGLIGAGFVAGAAGFCVLEGGGATDVAGETGACAAAKLNAASDSATEQSGRSTRYV